MAEESAKRGTWRQLSLPGVYPSEEDALAENTINVLGADGHAVWCESNVESECPRCLETIYGQNCTLSCEYCRVIVDTCQQGSY